MDITIDGPLDNANAVHRRFIIAELERNGLMAFEYHSGGGNFHVVVELLDKGSDTLYIASGDLVTACDIALMGWRGGHIAQSQEWTSVSTPDEAIATYLRLWDQRDALTNKFLAGELDVR